MQKVAPAAAPSTATCSQLTSCLAAHGKTKSTNHRQMINSMNIFESYITIL